MTTNCTPDELEEFYNLMTLAGVEGQPPREVEKLPLSNCNTYQEIFNFEDFEQEVSNKGKTINENQKFKFEEIANIFSNIIHEKSNSDDTNFKLTNEIILLVGREIQNSIDFISITDERENPNAPNVLLDKKNHTDRFAGKHHKVEVSKELIEMLKNEIFNKIQNLTPEQMLSILMAFFLSDLIVRQYQSIFVDDFENGYRYSTVVAEINPGKLGKVNFQYIEKNKETISKLFKIQSDKLGNSTYEIIIGPSSEIQIVKSYFVFEAVMHDNLGDEKNLLAMIHTKITYFLSSNHKTIEDEFRWILCEQNYNLIKQNIPTPWFIKCLSVNKDLKPVTKVEASQFDIDLIRKRIVEAQNLIEQTTVEIENSSNLPQREIDTKIEQNELNKRTLTRLQKGLQASEVEHNLNVEEAKIGIGTKVLSKMKENPGKTMLGIGSLTAAGILTGLAFTTGLGGKHTKKPKRKLKKRVTQRKPKILTKNNTKKRKKIKKRRRVKTIKKR
jgi:hypothetical protein